MAIHVMENYVSLEEYAALCGKERRAVLNRVRKGYVHAVKIDGYYAINTTSSPPRAKVHKAWKSKGGGTAVIHTELRRVVKWCLGKNKRCFPYLRAIIIGKIDGWVYGGEVFARAEDLQNFKW